LSITSRFLHGPRVSTQAAADYLQRLFTQPAHQVPPVCLWGKHGIGKTELILALAQEKDWPCRVISPAQFEEMGDLIGLPYLEQQEDGRAISRFAPPEWIPREDGPGILLIDDFNRADDRILRGLMALWQERRLSSWALPKDWYLLLTGNPEGQQYSVTPVDEATISRMLHLELVFEVDSWAKWAETEGIPQKAIDFVRQHPESIDGEQTTARTLTFLFRLWQQYGQPMPSDPQLALLAHSAVGPQSASAFVAFLANESIPLPSVVEFLEASLATQTSLLKDLLSGDLPRVDRLATLGQNILHYLKAHPDLAPKKAAGLEQFLLLPDLPADQRLVLLHGISKEGHPVLGQLLRHAELSRLVLG
jgi:hypothetical protein